LFPLTNSNDTDIQSGANRAEIIRRFFAQKAIDHVDKCRIDFHLVPRAFRSAVTENDRSCAIVIFSLIDGLLCSLISVHIIEKIRKEKGGLFGDSGLLPTSAQRIRFAFALGWIDDDTRHDLDLSRKIRNDFAHELSAVSFSYSQIKGRVASFRLNIDRMYGEFFADLGIDEENVRRFIQNEEKIKYLLCSCALVERLLRQMLLNPFSHRFMTSPSDMLNAERQSKNLSILSDAVVESLTLIFQQVERQCGVSILAPSSSTGRNAL
jgi:hypothetical protein